MSLNDWPDTARSDGPEAEKLTPEQIKAALGRASIAAAKVDTSALKAPSNEPQTLRNHPPLQF